MRHLPLVAAVLTSLAACQYEAPRTTATTTATASTSSRRDAVFVNGDFEDGGLSGWTVSTFQNRGITYPPASRADLKLLDGGTNRTKIVTGPTETLIPAGLDGGASLRVPKYGQNAVVVNELGTGYNANTLVQQFTVGASDVDPADGKVHVRFALAPVLNSGGHGPADQPYFWVTLTNVTKGATLFGTFNFADQSGVPWQVQGTNYYTDWQSFDIAPGNVALALGDTVRLEVIGAGCSQSGHWGEVYVDGFGAFLPGLQVAASAPQSANAGSNVTYTVNYQNRGTGTAANTTVTFNLPANVSFQSVSAPGATCTTPAVGATTGQVVCNVGSLNPNAAGSFTLTVQIAATATGKISAGNYTIRADGVTPLIGPLVETAITTAVSYADLSATLVDSVAAVGWGQAYSFTFTVANAGPVAANNAPVSWSMPAQLASASWTCTGSGTGTCGSASGVGSIASPVSLPSGTSVTFSVSGTLIAGSSSGSMINLVTITAPAGITDNNSTNNQAIDTNAIGALRTITFAKSGTGTGRVVTSPAAVDCVAGCATASTSFIDGTVVSVTATASSGHSFSGWSGLCTGAANPCSFTVSGNGTLTAGFAGPSSIITASAGLGGGISPNAAVSVASGANQTFTITPALGFSVADVLVDGASVGAVTSYTFTNVMAPHTIAASFGLNTFLLTSSAGANGSISASQTVAFGGAATFTITPAANHHVANVLVDGVSVGAVSSFTFANVTAVHTISATFELDTFLLASSAGPNGSISASQTVAHGSSATFTLTPAANHHVANVLVDGVSVGAVASFTFSNVTAAHTISATFDIDTFLLSSSASADGTISTSRTVAYGGAATFTITPAANHHVIDVLVDGQSVGAVGSYTFWNVTAPHSIAASFGIDTFVVSSSAGANGSISSSQVVAYGGSATFVIAASPNHHIADVKVDGQSVGAVGSYTFTNVTAARSISATFATDTFVVSSSAGPNGTISASQSVAHGGSVTFSVVPAPNHHIVDVRVDGQSVGAVSSYTFTNVTSVHSITATFAIDTWVLSSSAGANGSISGSQTVAHGQSATFTISPAANHHVAEILVDGQPVGAVASYTFTNVTAAHSISASFAIDTFLLTSSAGANGSISPSLRVDAGGATTFTISPAVNHHIASVLVDGQSVGAVASYTFSNVTAAHTIAATFAIDTFVVASMGDANGTVDCVSPVAHGAVSVCTITPAQGYELVALLDDGQAASVQGASYSALNVTAPRTITGVFKRSRGVECTSDVECGSGVCADGVCCNSACNGQCEACDVSGHAGECTPVAGAPHGTRTSCDTDGSQCGGTCDGNTRTSCTYPGASTSCRAASCTGGVATLEAACDGQGSCPAEQTEACAPFVCGATACAGDCTRDSDCSVGNWCAAGRCEPRKLAGVACGADNQCGSGFCTDGVCCNVACDGQCEACDIQGSVGTCNPVSGAPHAGRPECASDQTSCGGICDGERRDACAYPGASTQCRAPSCAAGVATLAAACDGQGSCPVEQTRACGEFICGANACLGDCQADSDCAAGNWCEAGVCVVKSEQGGSCATDSQCGSGNCVDGVCCNTACEGQCQACDVPGLVGTCTAVTGAPHGQRASCDTDGSACGGTCDGENTDACAYPTVSCRDASCADGVATAAARCSAGRCPAPQEQACGQFACGVSACNGDCTSDADCAGSSWCSAGVCTPKQALGGACTSDTQCGGGNCVDGVCCNTACDGQCEACDVAGSVGTCAPVAGAPHGSRAACATDGSMCGGTCDGSTRDACSYPEVTVECVAASCTNGVETRSSSCNGAGACAAPQTALCGQNACGETSCEATCTSDAQCGVGSSCVAGTCESTCTSDAQCGAGSSCVAGTCEATCTSDAQCGVGSSCVAGACEAKADSAQWKVQGGVGFGCQSTGGELSGLGLLLFGLALASRRRALRSAAAAAVLSVLVLGATTAQAQAQSSSVSRSFLLERFTPQAGESDVLGVQSPSISAHLLPRVSAWVSYADVPLRAVRMTDDGMQQMLAANQTTATLAGSVGFFGRVELGVALPVVITQTVGAASIADGLSAGGSQVSLGDVRLQAKAQLFDVGAFSFGASVPVTLPTAGNAPYAGATGVTATPTMLAQWSGPRRAAVLVNLGVALRQPQQLLNLTVGNAMTWSVGGKIDLVPRHDLSAMVNVGGEIGLLGAAAVQNPLEALVALRWMPIKGLALTLGAGPGLSQGYGTPRFRVVASIGWVPPERELPAHPRQSPAADEALTQMLPPVVAASPTAPAPVQAEVEEAPRSAARGSRASR